MVQFSNSNFEVLIGLASKSSVFLGGVTQLVGQESYTYGKLTRDWLQITEPLPIDMLIPILVVNEATDSMNILEHKQDIVDVLKVDFTKSSYK